MRETAPEVAVTTLAARSGSNEGLGHLITEVLNQNPYIRAVYSSGGANDVILRTFTDQGHARPLMAGHDLDRTNAALLQDQKLDFVIHHDLRSDARRTFQHILKFHRMLPDDLQIPPTQFGIITPLALAGSDQTPMSKA